jgi:hypothetical protein
MEPSDMTEEEAAELVRLWSDELAVGWIPTPAEVADALGALREHRRRQHVGDHREHDQCQASRSKRDRM